MNWTESGLGKVMLALFLTFLTSGIALCFISAFHPVGYFGIALVFLAGVFLGQLMEIHERVILQRELRIIPPIQVHMIGRQSEYLNQGGDKCSCDTIVQVPPKKDK